MTADTPNTKENILYLIAAEGIQKQQLIADRLPVSKGRVSQLKKELVEEGLVKEEKNLLYPTEEAHQRLADSPYVKSLEDFKESKFKQGVRIENATVRLRKRNAAATAGEEWIDKVTKKTDKGWKKPENTDNLVATMDDYILRLCPDAVVIHFQELTDRSLTNAKGRAIERSFEIIEELEEEADITLKIDDARFDAEIRGDEIKMLTEPEIFKAGSKEIEIEELDTNQEVFEVWSEKDEEYFKTTPKPTESQIERYRKLLRSFLYDAEEWLKLPKRVAKLEDQMQRRFDGNV